MQPGVERTLLDMIVQSNTSFDKMVGAVFPRVEMKVLHPVHKCLGELDIAGGGILCLSEADVGTMKVFYDITKAEAQGYFGENPHHLGRARVYDADRDAHNGNVRQRGSVGKLALPPHDVVGQRLGQKED